MAPRLQTTKAHFLLFVLFAIGNPANVAASPVNEGNFSKNFSVKLSSDLQSANGVTSVSFYVKSDATGNNDGSSWQNAYTSFATALTNCTPGDTIRVAAGTYTSPGGAFVLKDSIVVLGGYPATGNPDDSQRNWGVNQTILSGEAGNTEYPFDNLPTVVSCSGLHIATVLDGFIIENGFSNNTLLGVAINLANSSPHIKNCVFRGNSSYNTSLGGSSIACQSQSNPVISNCFFVNNHDFGFGTVFIKNNSNPTLVNCVFSGNDGRCVLYANQSEPSIINCTFFNNQIGNSYFPGGIKPGFVYAENSAVLNVSNCIFYRNKYINSFDTTDFSLNSSVINITNTITQNYHTSSDYLLNADPRFSDSAHVAGTDNLYFTSDDGLQLEHCSPAINAGMAVTPGILNEDIILHQRVFGNNPDLGAYEYQTVNNDHILSVSNDSLVANREYTGQDGWTNYYRDCDLLLSVKKNGQQIGSINDGVFRVVVKTTAQYGSGAGTVLSNAAYVTPGVSWNILNRYWVINATSQPTDSVQIRFPWSLTDITDATSINPAVSTPQQLVFFSIDTSLNIFDPAVPAADFHPCFNSGNASMQSWSYTVADTISYATFFVKKLNTGGIGTGSGLNKGPFAVAVNTCSGSDRIFTAPLSGDFYQWQVDAGNGFTDISNGASYSGATTNTLTILSPVTSAYGNLFRCRVTTNSITSYSSENKLTFQNQWKGIVNTSWNQSGNWSCGSVPDAFTDVVIPGGTTYNLIITSNVSCHSLRMLPNASATLQTGKKLTITGH